jgi:rhamnogalacturonan endolyase
VPNYIPPRARTAFHARVALPASATGAIIALTASGHDAQDNAAAPTAFQYWARVPRGGGSVSIADVVPAPYRVTLYADGVFGDWARDGVRSDAHASAASAYVAEWTVEESAGREAWRLGVPDRSSGEFRHGHAVDASAPARKWPLQEYRLFYKLFNFTADFPSGINYRIGTSKPERDWNYAQWSSPRGSAAWRVSWNGSVVPAAAGNATLTVQLAGVRTSTGNEHYLVEGQVAEYLNLELNANVNGKDVGSWFIPYVRKVHRAARC